MSNQKAGAGDRLLAWHAHFKFLLGNPPVIDNEEEYVVPVYKDLLLDEKPVTPNEYQKGKRSMKAGKICGEDWIVPKCLK